MLSSKSSSTTLNQREFKRRTAQHPKALEEEDPTPLLTGLLLSGFAHPPPITAAHPAVHPKAAPLTAPQLPALEHGHQHGQSPESSSTDHRELAPSVLSSLSAGSGGQLTLQSSLCKKRPKRSSFTAQIPEIPAGPAAFHRAERRHSGAERSHPAAQWELRTPGPSEALP